MNFLLLCLLAAEIPDLGVISHRTGATIDQTSTRSGFVRYIIEVKPQSTSTNVLTLSLTNNLLTVGDMTPIPSGPGVLGVKAVYADGEESEVAIYRYDLRRSKPPAPSMTPTHLGVSDGGESSLTNEMRKIREYRGTPIPPMPVNYGGTNFSPQSATNAMGKLFRSQVWPTEYTSGLQYDQPKRKQIVDRPTALPNGTNLSYFQFLDRLADSWQSGRRRSE